MINAHMMYDTIETMLCYTNIMMKMCMSLVLVILLLILLFIFKDMKVSEEFISRYRRSPTSTNTRQRGICR